MHAFEVLGEPVRRRILERLGKGEATSGEMVDVVQAEFPISQAAVSQHLKVLRDAGFASVRPAGTRRIYTFEPAAMAEVDAWLDQFRPGNEHRSRDPESARAPLATLGHSDLLDALANGTTREQATAIAAITEQASGPVAWADAAWDLVLAIACRPANDNCAAAGRLLCLLAKDGQEARMSRDFDRVFALVKDDRLAVARTVLREIWRVGLVSEGLRRTVVDGLQDWFHNCTSGKNSIQIRFDIIDGLAKLHRATGDPYVSQVTSTIVSSGASARKVVEGPARSD
ncbi:MAG: winged helix-turn-helix transcriptional regulator [Fimbriimonadaceae bacterium]|nr:winged helix-turn-helix transcriptional regulator [Fimbriimonadaceae bacterium]